MNLGAYKAIGFDISDVAIEEAQKLAAVSKLNSIFIRTNILEISKEFDGMFDFIYISEGSLQWFPDLGQYLGVISRFLKWDGHVLIYEMHPFAYLFEQIRFSNGKISLDDLISYFKKGPYSYEQGLDYVGNTQYQAKKCYWFMHELSDIMNAILKNNIKFWNFWNIILKWEIIQPPKAWINSL